MHSREQYIGHTDIVSRPAQIKGNLVNSRARYILTRWGQGELDAVAARLSGEARRYLTEKQPASTWHEYRPLMEIDAAIIEGPMGGDTTKMFQFGGEIAFYDLSSIYRALIRMSSPEFLLSHIGIAHGLYFRSGKMRSPTSARDHVMLVCEGAAHPRYMCTEGMTGWFCAAAELAGAKHVKGVQTKCQHDGAPRCEWRIEWKTDKE